MIVKPKSQVHKIEVIYTQLSHTKSSSMAQEKQHLLIVWLDLNKLHFIKDALVAADYTLDMVLDMTDDDMNGIFDELNVANLNRPRFRNAVKRLKQTKKKFSSVSDGSQSLAPAKTKSCIKNNNENKNNNTESTDVNQSSKQHSRNSSLMNNSKVIKRCLVLNICISKYGKNGFEDLEGPKSDMNKLIDLWENIFGYQIICNDYDKKIGYYLSKNDFLQKLDECRILLRSNKHSYDGLIFVFSGHGYKTSIVTSDSCYVSIDKIKRHFGAKQIEKLKDKPKIYIFDCCRSENGHASLPFEDNSLLVSQTIEEKEQNVEKRAKSGLSKNGNLKFYHPFSNTIEIYGNTQGYAVTGSKTGGSLITLITKHLSNYAINDAKTKILSKRTFHQLLYPVQREIHNRQGGNQTMEIINRSLGYDLYLSTRDRNMTDIINTNLNSEYINWCGGSSNNNNNNNNDSKHSDARIKNTPDKAVNTEQQQSEHAHNNISWRFDFHHNYRNKGSNVHGIECNGKRYRCADGLKCHCFSSISNVGMAPNSGIYSIKIKIDNIDNGVDTYGNIIGLTSDNFSDGKSSFFENDENKTNNWQICTCCNNWIGWSSRDKEDDNVLPYGLYCGEYWSVERRAENIFRCSKFLYKSQNGKYLKRLPIYQSGDIVLLSYNSDLKQLSFKLFKSKFSLFSGGWVNEKESLLDSYIYNLPSNLTFYWFFGHSHKRMSMTILD